MITLSTETAKTIPPNLSVSAKGPNTNEIPSFAYDIKFCTPLERASNAWRPASHFKTINANKIWIINPAKIVRQLTDFLAFDKRKAIPSTINMPAIPHNMFIRRHLLNVFWEENTSFFN